MGNAETVQSTQEAFSELSELFDSLNESGIFETLAEPTTIEATEKAAEELSLLGKASCALGVASIGLEIGLEIAGVESPEDKLESMVEALSDQISAFQDDIDDRFKRLGAKVQKLAEENKVFDHVNKIQSFQGTVDVYWSELMAGTDQSAIDSAATDVAKIDIVNQLRPAFEAIHTITRGGLVNGNILDAVYQDCHGGDEVRRLGLGLQSLAAAAPRIEALQKRIACQGDANAVRGAQSTINSYYSTKLDEITTAVSSALKACIDIERLKQNYPLRVAAFCAKQDGSQWVSLGKQAFFVQMADGILADLRCYPWLEWAVAFYDGFRGWGQHGYGGSSYEPSGSHPFFSLRLPSGGALAVNMVVYFKDKGKPYLGLPPGIDEKLKGVVDSMQETARTTTLTDYGPADIPGTSIDDVRPYLGKFSDDVVSIHIVRNTSNPAFRCTDSNRMVEKRGSVFTGYCFG